MKEFWKKPSVEKVYFDVQDSILHLSGDTPACRTHCGTICYAHSYCDPGDTCPTYSCTINCSVNG